MMSRNIKTTTIKKTGTLNYINLKDVHTNTQVVGK